MDGAQTVFGLTLDEVRQMMKRDAERAERTCRNVNEGHSFTCSECGDCTFNPFPEIMPSLKLNYCPGCGARVMEE